METKHTPGPWEVTQGSGTLPIQIIHDRKLIAAAVRRVDAKLIAQAPDLLAKVSEQENEIERLKAQVKEEGFEYFEINSKRIEELEKEKQLTINGSELNTLLYQEQIKKLEEALYKIQGIASPQSSGYALDIWKIADLALTK